MTPLRERIYRVLRLRKAYRVALAGEAGDRELAARVVLADLARFCRANTSSVVMSPVSRTVDTHATMVAEGRREVWNRLAYHLNLSEDEILKLKEQADEQS